MKALVILALIALASAAKVSYQGYQVWRLEVEPKQHAAGLRGIIDEHNIDVWGEGMDWIDLMVSPQQNIAIFDKLATLGIHSKVMIHNVQTLVDRDYKAMESRTPQPYLVFTQYNTFEEIEAYLIDLPSTDSRTSLERLASTVEGRDLLQLKISVGAGRLPIWIDCGIHAREWITPATCLWGINYLLSSYGTDQSVTGLLDMYDLYILPVNNPDGYAYTHSDDRMWRKNRNQYEGDACAGIDLNRNFDDHFAGEGTSNVSCAQTYHGPSAASEKETQGVQAGITDLAGQGARALFSIHSYSQLWMYAFGWTSELAPEDAELNEVSRIGVEALTAVHGTQYEYGPVSTTIYPAASTTVDYGYSAGIVHSYTLELRDKGFHGFLLPEDQIVPTAEETWAGLIAGIMAVPASK